MTRHTRTARQGRDAHLHIFGYKCYLHRRTGTTHLIYHERCSIFCWRVQFICSRQWVLYSRVSYLLKFWQCFNIFICLSLSYRCITLSSFFVVFVVVVFVVFRRTGSYKCNIWFFINYICYDFNNMYWCYCHYYYYYCFLSFLFSWFLVFFSLNPSIWE